MKKIAAMLLAVLSLAVLAGCHAEKQTAQEESEEEIYTVSEETVYNDYAEYYGCPNSKRISKLNLRKKRKSL